LWSILVGLADTASLPALDVAVADPFQSLSADQSQFIDFDAQAQLMSTSTASPVDLLLSASADQGLFVIIVVYSNASVNKTMISYSCLIQ